METNIHRSSAILLMRNAKINSHHTQQQKTHTQNARWHQNHFTNIVLYILRYMCDSTQLIEFSDGADSRHSLGKE